MPGRKSKRAQKSSELEQPTVSNSSLRLVSVVVPAREEVNTIGSITAKIKESLSGKLYEIIVIDDGSKDRTAEIAKANGATVISHNNTLGKGAAMKTGADNAKGDIIVFLDGDGAHDPQDIGTVVAPILEERADLVIGSRSLAKSKVSRPPFGRRLSNSLASFVISVIISFLIPLVTPGKCPMKWIKSTDCTSGFRAITKKGWKKLTLVSEGFQIETEMIFEAARNNLKIAEVPINCKWSTQNSRLSIFGDGLRTLRLLAGKLLMSGHNKS